MVVERGRASRPRWREGVAAAGLGLRHYAFGEFEVALPVAVVEAVDAYVAATTWRVDKAAFA